MGRVLESSTFKRKRPDGNSRAQNLTDAERMLLEVIKSKTDMGIWKGDMKKEISNKTLPDRIINKSLNDLKLKQLIKEVPNIHNKTKKLYMAIEFEPSSELTGGEWYTNGSLDGEFINMLKRECLLHIRRSNVSTIKEIVHAMNTRKVCTDDCSIQRITEIVRLLVLDNEVVEVKSTGIGNFVKIPVGTTCYKCTNTAAVSKVGAMASIPCGVCPRIQECTPDGIISPNTCLLSEMVGLLINSIGAVLVRLYSNSMVKQGTHGHAKVTSNVFEGVYNGQVALTVGGGLLELPGLNSFENAALLHPLQNFLNYLD